MCFPSRSVAIPPPPRVPVEASTSTSLIEQKARSRLLKQKRSNLIGTDDVTRGKELGAVGLTIPQR